MLFKIKDRFKPIFIDRAARRMVIFSIFFNLASWCLLIFRLFPLLKDGRLIALHYSVYLKVSDVGSAGFALLSPAIGLLIIILNFWLAVRLYVSNRQNSIMILTITAFYELLLLVAAFFVILINLTR